MWMPGKMPAHDDREDRHRLGEAVDRGAPVLPEQEQDGADQRAGVTDTDPEDEVDDVEAPRRPGIMLPQTPMPFQNSVADAAEEAS